MVKLNFVWLKKQDEGGATEGEVAFFSAFFLGGVGRVGLVDGADVGGANFDKENGAEFFRFQVRDHAFVFDEVVDVFLQSKWVDGVEGTVDELRFCGCAVTGKMKAMVVDWREAGDDKGTSVVAFGEVFIAKEFLQTVGLVFYFEIVARSNVGINEVASVGGKNEVDWCEGAFFGFEFAGKKVVE